MKADEPIDWEDVLENATRVVYENDRRFLETGYRVMATARNLRSVGQHRVFGRDFPEAIEGIPDHYMVTISEIGPVTWVDPYVDMG